MLNINVKQNLENILLDLPKNVRLVAVSKYHPIENIQEAYLAGQRIFGESHVQELRKKQPFLPDDIQWHFIGHLQTNKVKYIAPYISMIESVDSERLISEINKEAAKNNRTIDILLELHISDESTKSGFSINECNDLLNSSLKERYSNVRICGLMTMASNTEDKNAISEEFKKASDYFDYLKSNFFPNDNYFCERSWGMSSDYLIAIQNKSTLVRIGTAVFGPRIY